MMTCRELCHLLIDFVSGELPPEYRERIEKHLQCCPPCVAYFESYRATIQLTRKLPCSALPPELMERLRAALEEIQKDGGDAKGKTKE